MLSSIVRIASLALAGHAGDMENPGAPVVLPFEMWLGMMGVAVLLLIAIGWLVGNAVRLRKIDRRLQVLEGTKKE